MDLLDLIGEFFTGTGDAFSGGGGSGLVDVAKDIGANLGGDLATGSGVSTALDSSLPALGEAAGKVAPEAGDWASKLWGGAGDAAGGFGKFAKGALPFAQIGATGYGIASNVKAQQLAAENAKRIKESFALQERAAVPLTNFGETQIKNAQAGNVPTAVQAQIDLWAQGAKQKARDYLARAGIGDSSAAAQWDAYIDQQAQAMKASALSDESRQGVDALSRGAGAAAGVGQQAGQQQSSLETLIASANQQLMRLAGSAA